MLTHGQEVSHWRVKSSGLSQSIKCMLKATLPNKGLKKFDNIMIYNIIFPRPFPTWPRSSVGESIGLVNPLIWIILDHSSHGKNEAGKSRIWSTKMAARRLPVNRNHGNICAKSGNICAKVATYSILTKASKHTEIMISLCSCNFSLRMTLDLEYQDGAGGFKILLAEYIVCVIRYYSDRWVNWKPRVCNPAVV